MISAPMALLDRRFDRRHDDRRLGADNREVETDAVELDLSMFRWNQVGRDSKRLPLHPLSLHVQR